MCVIPSILQTDLLSQIITLSTMRNKEGHTRKDVALSETLADAPTSGAIVIYRHPTSFQDWDVNSATGCYT